MVKPIEFKPGTAKLKTETKNVAEIVETHTVLFCESSPQGT